MVFDQPIRLWQVDAFTDQPFAGNPAAVCVLDQFPTDEWMQNVAAEMNLSETAFVVATETPNRFQLRWFTPATEVDLCGHATLATTHALVEQQIAKTDSPIRFETRSGELTCTVSANTIQMDFPAEPVDGTIATELCNALGIDSVPVYRNRFDLIVVVDDASQVESVCPDFSRLQTIETRGVILTSRGDAQAIDFVSRFFAPRCGINEDPVTGSAHCCLAPYWSSVIGKDKLAGYQASRRGGTVHCEVNGDRVLLSGNAVTVMRAELAVTCQYKSD